MPFGNGLGSKRVDRLPTNAFAGDKPRASKSTKVPAHQGLGHIRGLDQFRDGRRALGKSAHEVKAIGVAEGAMHATSRLDQEAFAGRLTDGGGVHGGALHAHRSTVACAVSI
jgi:hypothetical protein